MIFVVPQLLAAIAATAGRRVLVHVPLDAAGGSKSSSADGTLNSAIGHQFISFCCPLLPLFLAARGCPR
jgi:hypothetical protein